MGRKSSVVWKFFDLVGDSAKCRVCQDSVKYIQKSTSSMMNHLKLRHPTKINSEGPGQTTISSFAKKKCDKKRAEHITNLIARMVAMDSLPVSVVEGEGFAQLVSFLESEYVIPGRTAIQLRLLRLYEEKRSELRDVLGSVDGKVTLTTDCWSSRAMEGYMTVTVHFLKDWEFFSYVLDTKPVGGDETDTARHTAENLSRELKDVADAWGISGKTLAVLHDNASNVKAIADAVSAEDIPCAAHTLQLCVNAGLKGNRQIGKLMAASNRLVGHFRKSTLSTSALGDKLRLMGQSERKLVSSCPTRWNSVFDSWERLLELRWAVAAVLGDPRYTSLSDARVLALTDEQWNLMAALIPCLKPLKCATTVLSGEKYPTVSNVFPIMTGIAAVHMRTTDEDTIPAVRNFKEVVKSEITRRFDLEGDAVTPALIAAGLDPRYKDLQFLPATRRQAVKDAIADMVPDEDNPAAPTPKRRRLSDNADSAMDFLLGVAQETADENSGTEYEKFLALPLTKTKAALWWRDNGSNFPGLSKIAANYLAVPATSVPSERVFSTAGNIVNSKRSSLLAENVNMLVFLHMNL